MLGKCFAILCVISFAFGACTGNMEGVCNGILEGASKSVTVCFSLIGIMALWSGIMAVLQKAGAVKGLSRLLSPVLKLIFPRAFRENIATEEITACVSAGLIGISNATTPLALKAIDKMQSGRSKKIEGVMWLQMI